ncbi:MAG: hypothetical protein J6N18_10680 [Kiritimatiellae bacterium]|nr:hypothetical protein [Kiritimatiellia bacterium]
MRLNYTREQRNYDNTIYFDLQDPSNACSLETLRCRDRNASNLLARLQSAIDRVQAYRLDMADRAQFLATAAYTVSVELHRHRAYQGGVTFQLETVRTYSDGTRHTESRTVFTGKERHKAIAAYKAACRAYPGAENVLDIEKARWER